MPYTLWCPQQHPWQPGDIAWTAVVSLGPWCDKSLNFSHYFKQLLRWVFIQNESICWRLVIIHSSLFISSPILPSFQFRKASLSQSQPLRLLSICLFAHHWLSVYWCSMCRALGNSSASSFDGCPSGLPSVRPCPVINAPSFSGFSKSFPSSSTPFFLSP